MTPSAPQHGRITIALVLAEAFWLLVMVVAFWHHSPPIREHWVWLLWGIIPCLGLRWLILGRFVTYTPLLPWLLMLIPLSLFNYHHAPYARADYVVLICRPLLGILLVLHALEHGRLWRHMASLWGVSMVVAACVAILALTATQWDISKSYPFATLIESLPQIAYRTWFPDMLLSFNPNEIAGAMALLCPLMAGLMWFAPDHRARVLAGVIFLGLCAALILGQSRFAMAGVILGLGLLGIPLRSWRWRGIWYVGLALWIALQVGLLWDNNYASTETAINQSAIMTASRDQSTWQSRLDLWRSSLQMVMDYPATGVGMSMFRTAIREPRYITPFYIERGTYPPHAHQAWLQIGADLGLGGMLLYSSWHILMVWMLWHSIQHTSSTTEQRIAWVLAAALIAYSVYGLGDTITLWDRYHFVWWWLMAIIAAFHIKIVTNRNVYS